MECGFESEVIKVIAVSALLFLGTLALGGGNMVAML